MNAPAVKKTIPPREILRDILIEQRQILAELRQQNTGKDTLWDADDIANYMRLAKSSVQSRILSNQSFPLAIKLPSSENGGGRRWLAAEVKEWVKRYKVKA